MAGQAAVPAWLATDWLLPAFSRRKSDAIEQYKGFVAAGKNQPSPWESLKNQIFLGTDAFVEEMQAKFADKRDLSEVPSLQRRSVPKPIAYYEGLYRDRDRAIAEAYASGGYGLKEIGAHFGLHYSRVSRIVRATRRQRARR